MSFSQDVKNYLKETTEEASGCCKKSFSDGLLGKTPNFRCKKCQTYYVAGVFCAYGTMSEPEKSFQLFVYAPAEVQELLYNMLSDSVSPKIGKSKGKSCIYFKGSEKVGDFLAFCRATPFAMRVYDVGIEKEEKLRVQRECNAEVANMVRASHAAGEQLEAIKILKKYNMLENLKKELRDAAILRESNPEAGLRELVSLSTDPVSKSGLNYRLKQLVSLAEELKSEEVL